MPFLIRRINRAKWEELKEEQPDDVSADAITNCLRTFHNDLSVWKIDNEADLEDAILALITGSKQAKLSTLHYVIIDENAVIKNNLDLVDTDGDTAVKSLVKNHNDISNLTYQKLGIVKNIVIDSIQNEKSSFFSKKQLKAILNNAIERGVLDKNDLNSELVEKEKL